MSRRPTRISERAADLAAPALTAPLVFADTNTSIGVIGLMVAIVVLVAVLLVLVAVAVTGEHRDNVDHHHHH